MDDMKDDGYGNSGDYDSDDSRNDAELVSTGLHAIQLTEEGGDDDGQAPADVRHQCTKLPFRRPNS